MSSCRRVLLIRMWMHLGQDVISGEGRPNHSNKLKCRRPDQSNPKIHFRLESLTVNPVLRYEATWFPHKCNVIFVAVVLVENLTLHYEKGTRLASNIEIERFCSFSIHIVPPREKSCFAREKDPLFHYFPERLCSKVRNTFLLCEFGKGKKSYKNRRGREHYFVTNSFDFLDLLAGRHDVRKWCKNKDRTQMW